MCAPRLVELAGIKAPSWMRGHDWSSYLRGSDDPGPAEVLLEMTDSPLWTPAYLNWRGFTDGRWKYAFYENGYEQLFDLAADPYEQTNPAESNRQQCSACRGRLLQLLVSTRGPFFDVIIQHGSAPPKQPRYLAPQHADMGFPRGWPSQHLTKLT
jgi:hypothetical protein